MAMYRAVVFGATGAIGKEVVRELAASPRCESIVAVTRREVPATEWVGETAAEAANKIRCKVVPDFEKLSESLQAAELKEMGPQVAFYGLGSTRRDAGSAEAFRKIDLGYLQAAATLCKEAGCVKHFSLVSSVGASSGSIFLYMKVKGEGEDAVKAAGFGNVSLWRPGLLDRGDKARLVEKVGSWFSKALPAATVAKAMVRDAEAKVAAADSAAAAAAPAVFGNKEIYGLAA